MLVILFTLFAKSSKILEHGAESSLELGGLITTFLDGCLPFLLPFLKEFVLLGLGLKVFGPLLLKLG